MQKLREAYDAGNPMVSDTEYDALAEIYGHELGTAGDIPHLFRMWSLNKHYMRDGEPPLNLSICTETPKLDGAAVELIYVGGSLAQALTRGDGHKGRDITRFMKWLVPNEIDADLPVMQITGEVCARADVQNSRNFASGALNLKSEDEWRERLLEGEMVFVAYSVQVKLGYSGFEDSDYISDMHFLSAKGFDVVTIFNHEDYPKDGTVYRITNNNLYNAAGVTSKFPKGAIAVKEAEDEYITVLRSVEWETGQSGKVTPVGIYDPVDTGDAILTRATLNNVGYIQALDLEIGCEIVVVRAGDIIPRIIRRA